MELFSFVSGLMLGPFVMWWALSWWFIVPSLILFCASIGIMSPIINDWDECHPVGAFLCIAAALAWVSLGIGRGSEAQSFWSAVLAGIQFFVQCLITYVGIGIITLLPLWYISARRIKKRIEKQFKDFINGVLETDQGNMGRYDTFLTDEQKKEVKECNGVKNNVLLPYLQDMFKKYKERYRFDSLNAKDHLDVIGSLIFLWPIHILIEIFNIPKHVVTVLKTPLNFISRLVGKGLPNELK